MLSIGAGLGLFIAALGVQSTDDALTAPPVLRKVPVNTCTCTDAREPGIIILEGLIVDAEVTLAPDRISINDRQATIMDVAKSSDGVKGRTRIWHTTSEKSCGVTFDYGRTYEVAVRTTEDGEFETDQCLMRQAGD
ncbi:hypothetical protein MNBD_ALPHA05-537 [hydrothermal vent metagenome]|uniref:Uncharacterized protein n=1 Tax=hydrothermal vent metagenome TaxID=652676 RepID=A0A3B0TC47_9ZZZZ